MIVVHSLEEFTKERSRFTKGSIAFVPTMGALHEGHMALVEKAKALADYCFVSVFVNPIQFDQKDDFARYPKVESEDIAILEKHGVDLVWFPKVEDIYPSGFATHIEVAGPALQWEGALRPGHFSGVATVIYRLFCLIQPAIACFGEKDWQQLQVIQRMVKDLMLPVSIVGVPIVREESGLAKSSRNRFLSSEEYQQASFLYQLLCEIRQSLEKGEPIAPVLETAVQQLEKAGFKVNYLKVVDGSSLNEASEWNCHARLIAAAQLGSVRLLDNL